MVRGRDLTRGTRCKRKIERMRRWGRVSRKFAPDEWRRRIDDLVVSAAVRIQVACIIWWDYFADHSPRWGSLDDLVAAWRPDQCADRDCVRDALEHLGYPPHMARERVREKF